MKLAPRRRPIDLPPSASPAVRHAGRDRCPGRPAILRVSATALRGRVVLPHHHHARQHTSDIEPVGFSAVRCRSTAFRRRRMPEQVDDQRPCCGAAANRLRWPAGIVRRRESLTGVTVVDSTTDSHSPPSAPLLASTRRGSLAIACGPPVSRSAPVVVPVTITSELSISRAVMPAASTLKSGAGRNSSRTEADSTSALLALRFRGSAVQVAPPSGQSVNNATHAPARRRQVVW